MALGKFKTPMDIISRRLTFLAGSQAPSLGRIRLPSFQRHIETPYMRHKYFFQSRCPTWISIHDESDEEAEIQLHEDYDLF